jgi:hypothetical protein
MRDANDTADGDACNGNTRYWHTLSISYGAAADRDHIAHDRPTGRRCTRTSHRNGQPNRPLGMHADPAANESASIRDAYRVGDRAFIRRAGCERGCRSYHSEYRASSGYITGDHRSGRHARTGVGAVGNRRGTGSGIIRAVAAICATARRRSRVAATATARLLRPGWQYAELGW